MADNIKKVIEDDGIIRSYLGDLHPNPEGLAVVVFDGRHKEYWIKALRHRSEGSLLLNTSMVIMNTGGMANAIIQKV